MYTYSTVHDYHLRKTSAESPFLLQYSPLPPPAIVIAKPAPLLQHHTANTWFRPRSQLHNEPLFTSDRPYVRYVHTVQVSARAAVENVHLVLTHVPVISIVRITNSSTVDRSHNPPVFHNLSATRTPVSHSPLPPWNSPRKSHKPRTAFPHATSPPRCQQFPASPTPFPDSPPRPCRSTPRSPHLQKRPSCFPIHPDPTVYSNTSACVLHLRRYASARRAASTL